MRGCASATLNINLSEELRLVKHWFYDAGGKSAGPVDEAHLNELVASGLINTETRVWRRGMVDWAPMSVAMGLEPLAPTETPPRVAPLAPTPPGELTQASATSDTPPAATSSTLDDKLTFQSAADSITSHLGLERIESFSASRFFADVFRKHSADEMENILSVGAPKTTPTLSIEMGILPNPWIFFRALVGSGLAFGIFYVSIIIFQNGKLIPGLLMIGAFAIPFSVLILFFELNTPRNISLFRVVQFVIVGGSASLLFSLFLFDLTDLSSLFGASAAGIVEEAGKLAAVLAAMKLVPADRYNFRLNALLFGAAVGTGFSAFETAGYALETPGEMLNLITLRGLYSPLTHVVWTAIAAAAYWHARQKTSDAWSTIASGPFLRLFAVPVALHFTWNLDISTPFDVHRLIIGFIGWVVVLSLVQTGLREVAATAEAQASTPTL